MPKVAEHEVQAACDIIISDTKSYSTSLNYAINYVRAAKGLEGHELAVQCLYILGNISRWRHAKSADVRRVLKQFAKEN